MLELSNVCVELGGKAILRNINLKLNGQNLCILGANGCGKTTLLKAMAGILPVSGAVTLGGQEIHRLPRKKVAAKIAMMSQIQSSYFPYTVKETVMLGRFQHQKRSLFAFPQQTKDHEFVNSVLETVGLKDLGERRLEQLSGGQLQRVFLAQVLAQDPEIILLDEPTNHLDMKYQLELIDYLKAWSTAKNRLVVGVFHDLNLALRLSENLLFLKDGEITGMGKASDLLSAEFLQDIYDVDIAAYMKKSLERWNEIC